MSQKAVKYFLIGGVVVVWGLIIYRVIDGLSGDDNIPVLKASAVVQTGYVAPTDSFTLIADYSDPFIPGKDTVDTSAPATMAVQAAAPPPPPPVAYTPPAPVEKEATIQYLGMIANPQKKLKIATLNLNGRELLVKEKDKIDGYTIQKISSESILIRYKGKNITLNRNQ